MRLARHEADQRFQARSCDTALLDTCFGVSNIARVHSCVTMTVKVAHVRLSHSRMPYIRAYANCTYMMPSHPAFQSSAMVHRGLRIRT